MAPMSLNRICDRVAFAPVRIGDQHIICARRETRGYRERDRGLDGSVRDSDLCFDSTALREADSVRARELVAVYSDVSARACSRRNYP